MQFHRLNLSSSQSWPTTLANSDLHFLYSQSEKFKNSDSCDRGWYFTQTYNKLVEKEKIQLTDEPYVIDDNINHALGNHKLNSELSSIQRH